MQGVGGAITNVPCGNVRDDATFACKPPLKGPWSVFPWEPAMPMAGDL